MTDTSSGVLTYQSDGDENGLIFWTGSNGGVRAFACPASDINTEVPIITSASSSLSGDPSVTSQAVVDRAFGDWHSALGSGAWCQLELAGDASLIVKTITIRDRQSDTVHLLKNFAIEASNDTVNWERLVTNTNSPIGQGLYRSFDVSSNNTAYKYFRVLLTGYSTTNAYYLVFSELELYGIFDNGYALSIGGQITENLAAVNWLVRAYRVTDGVLTAQMSTPSGAFTLSIPSLENVPHYLTVTPDIGSQWQAGSSVIAGQMCFPSDLLTTPYYFTALNAGTMGTVEPNWTTNPGDQFSDNDITWELVERLPQPQTHGPIIPS